MLTSQSLDSTSPRDESYRNDEQARLRMFLQVSLGVLALGLFGNLLFGAQSSLPRVRLALWGLGIVSSGAAAMVGVLTGYIFGIPRTPNGELPANGAASPSATSPQYHANSSIEQISDWVVKILVGLGLTQLSRAPEGMTFLARAFENAVRQADPTTPQRLGLAGIGQFGAALVLYFAVCGFVIGYVHMRLYMAPAFRLADDRLNQKVEEATRTVRIATEEAAQIERDAKEKALEYERLTGKVLLRLYEPQGYDNALSVSDEYLRRYGDPGDSGFWLRYACAWGQKAADSAKNSTEYLEARKNALAAATRVIELAGPTGKQLLRVYWDTDKTGPLAENDLAPFYADEAFIDLLGPHGSSPP